MIVDVIEGAPGTQKSRTMLTEILEQPSRYLLAVPRIDLMDEHETFIRNMAHDLNVPTPILKQVHSGRHGDVRRQLKDAWQDCATSNHAVIFVTHETMRSTDLNAFQGWHARIDEVPDGVVSGSFQAGAAYRTLDPIYRLDPVGDGKWSQVVLRDEALRSGDVMNDTGAQQTAAFHKHASASQGLFVNVADWTEARGHGAKIVWWSLWTPSSLQAFTSVTIACASFEHSLCGLVIRNWYANSISIHSRNIGSSIARANPHINIHYFTENHTGSTVFWSTSEGRKCLNCVARYLQQIGGIGFWSGNTVVRSYLEHWFEGEMVLPKLAGTNTLIQQTSCAMIYSSKPQEGDELVYETFGIDKEGVKRARETEDLIQFVMRGAIRRPEFTGAYEVYVYERTQAEELAAYLRKVITPNVSLTPIHDAEIMDHTRPKAQSKSLPRKLQTVEERRADNNARQAKSRARRKAERSSSGGLSSPRQTETAGPTVQDGSP